MKKNALVFFVIALLFCLIIPSSIKATYGPDIKFTHRFGVAKGAYDNEIPWKHLKCEIINKGTTDVTCIRIHGEGRLVFTRLTFTPWHTAYSFLPYERIPPGQTAWYECSYLPIYLPILPRFIRIHLYFGTGQDLDHVTDNNYLNGTFIFWNDEINFLNVTYSD